MKRLISLICIGAVLMLSLSSFVGCTKKDDQPTPNYTIMGELSAPDILGRDISLSISDATTLCTMLGIDANLSYDSFNLSYGNGEDKLSLSLGSGAYLYSIRTDLGTAYVNDNGNESECDASSLADSALLGYTCATMSAIYSVAENEAMWWEALSQTVTPQKTQVPEGIKLEYALTPDTAGAILSTLVEKGAVSSELVAGITENTESQSASEALRFLSFSSALRLTLDNTTNAPLIIDMTAKYGASVFSLVYDAVSHDIDISIKTGLDDSREDKFSIKLMHTSKTELVLSSEVYTSSERGMYQRGEELRIVEDDSSYYLSYSDTYPDGTQAKQALKLTDRTNATTLSYEMSVGADSKKVTFALDKKASDTETDTVTYTALTAEIDEKTFDVSSLDLTLTMKTSD